MCDSLKSHKHTHTPFSSLIHWKKNHVQSMFMSNESVTIPPWEDKAPSTLSCAQFSQFACSKAVCWECFFLQAKNLTHLCIDDLPYIPTMWYVQKALPTLSFWFFIITWELTICPLPITYTFKINNLCRNIFSITLAPTIMTLFIALFHLL